MKQRSRPARGSLRLINETHIQTSGARNLRYNNNNSNQQQNISKTAEDSTLCKIETSVY